MRTLPSIGRVGVLTLLSCQSPSIDIPAPSVPTVAPARVHRLTRAQLDRAATELLGVPLRLAQWAPEDAQTAGFDNTEDGLFLTPTFVTALDSALRDAVDRAITPAGPWVITASQLARRCAVTEDCRSADVVPPTADGPGSASIDAPLFELPFFAPAPGMYSFNLDIEPGMTNMPEVLVDGAQVTTSNDAPMTLTELRFDTRELAVGPHVVTVVHMAPVTVHDLTITGPADPADPADPAHDALFACAPGPDAPATGEGDSWEACARTLLAPWLRRAWRRAPTAEEVDELVAVALSGRDQGHGFEASMGAALESALLSPWFLFRVEAGEGDDRVRRLTQLELASRLAFFLWSDLPDDELLGLAEQGALSDPATVTAQVRRMLAAPRRAGLVSDFAGQWLQLRQLDTFTPDSALYPGFSEELRAAMRAETEGLFTEVLTGERALGELVSSDAGEVPPPLDALYGLDAPGRHEDLGEYGRGGLFGQAAWLAVTSHSNRTSIVQRGKTVLVSLLCESVGSPPAGVNRTIDDADPYNDVLTRATNPECSTCHARMDPIGTALEGFDVLGAARVTYAGGAPVVTTATMLDGTVLSGAPDLGAWVAKNERLGACFAQQATTWAFGRALPADHPAVVGAVEALRASGGDVPTMITAIATSDAFQRLLEAR